MKTPSPRAGLVDNGTAYGMLISQEYFTEEERGEKVVIFITQKLVDYLDAYFARKQRKG